MDVDPGEERSARRRTQPGPAQTPRSPRLRVSNDSAPLREPRAEARGQERASPRPPPPLDTPWTPSLRCGPPTKRRNPALREVRMTAAKEYRTEQIRNVAVLGHGGSGKTTLVDALCFVAGSSRRHGNVREGTALTMYTPEEIGHGISMQVASAFAEWEGVKINLLDTPGYLDFTGEALAATRVADGAVVVLGATASVEVGTEKVWEYCSARGIPRLFFISMMDKEHADFEQVYRDIKETLTEKAVPVEIPIGAGDGFRGIINLFTGKAHIYRAGATHGEYEEQDVPADLQPMLEQWRTELLETIATTNDALLERYLEGGT